MAFANILFQSLKKSGIRDLPDVEGLRSFAMRKMSWAESKTDYHLLPILKRIENREKPNKSKISSYFMKNPS